MEKRRTKTWFPTTSSETECARLDRNYRIVWEWWSIGFSLDFFLFFYIYFLTRGLCLFLVITTAERGEGRLNKQQPKWEVRDGAAFQSYRRFSVHQYYFFFTSELFYLLILAKFMVNLLLVSITKCKDIISTQISSL